jgi:hypothetical protein
MTSTKTKEEKAQAKFDAISLCLRGSARASRRAKHAQLIALAALLIAVAAFVFAALWRG